jgi:hypothetical protein
MPTNNKELLELKKQMLALRNSIEDYLDGLDIDEADKPSKKKEKDNG